jgi:hypothetical protein
VCRCGGCAFFFSGFYKKWDEGGGKSAFSKEAAKEVGKGEGNEKGGGK